MKAHDQQGGPSPLKNIQEISEGRILVGIFVGGRSSRMGKTKGLLPPPDGRGASLVERGMQVASSALPGADWVLVGMRQEYAQLPYLVVKDAREDCGPLSGLVALLSEAKRQKKSHAIALACDMPYVIEKLVTRVAFEMPQASILCPFQEGRYQPLFARYSVDVVADFAHALEEGRLSLQPLLKHYEAFELTLDTEEQRQLRDWDVPEDLLQS